MVLLVPGMRLFLSFFFSLSDELKCGRDDRWNILVFLFQPSKNKNEEMLTNEKQTKTRFSYFIFFFFKRAVACVWGWKQQQQQRLHQNQPNVSAHLNTVYIPF
jgi:hypothetical protein